VFDHRQIERVAVIHDLTGELGGRDGFSIVRHCDDARFFHCSDFRDSFALLSTLAAPIGQTRVEPTLLALSTMKRVMDALS